MFERDIRLNWFERGTSSKAHDVPLSNRMTPPNSYGSAAAGFVTLFPLDSVRCLLVCHPGVATPPMMSRTTSQTCGGCARCEPSGWNSPNNPAIIRTMIDTATPPPPPPHVDQKNSILPLVAHGAVLSRSPAPHCIHVTRSAWSGCLLDPPMLAITVRSPTALA